MLEAIPPLMKTPQALIPIVERTLPRQLEAAARRTPQRTLFICGDQRWSVEETRSIALFEAARLAAAGIGRGDRVALLCGNRPEFMRVFLGCARLGAIAVPINTAVRAPQLRYYLGDSGARLLLIEAPLLPELDALDGDGLALEQVWVVGHAEPDEAPHLQPSTNASTSMGPATGGPARGTLGVARPTQNTPPKRWRIEPYGTPTPDSSGAESLRLTPDSTSRIAPIVTASGADEPGPGDPVAILYTSGTTGPSKGVICPHAQLHAWGANTARLLRVMPGDVLCTTLPLFHINALNGFIQALVSDATQVIEARFSVSGFWATMIRHRATVGYLLGAMVPMLLARDPSPEERAHSMRIALGPGVPPALAARFFERTGVSLLEGYGSTETNFVIAAEAGQDSAGTMGRLQSGFDARVVDDQDVELPRGQPGELVLRADEPFAFAAGYFGRPAQTVEAWRNLWFHTGDRVIRDADDRFVFVDRIKDAIRRRGENISSHEVEQVLLSHPAIANAAVFPVRSPLAEDEVMAALVLSPDTALDLPELIGFCIDRMPHFAVPRYIDLVNDLPRTENGKVRKVVLRERGVSSTTWDREAAGIVVSRRRPA